VTKRIPDDNFSLNIMVREIHALKLLQGHPHVVELVGVGCSMQQYTMKHGGVSLRDFCKGRGVVPLCEVKGIMHQLLQGLQAMHMLALAHRDLKPDNVLIDGHGVVRICDFGASCHSYCGPGGLEVGFENVMSCQEVCTSWYTPPEIMNACAFKTTYNVLKLDIWSAGVICLEMLRGHAMTALRHDDRKKRKTTAAERVFRGLFDAVERPALHGVYRKLLARMRSTGMPFTETLDVLLNTPNWNDDEVFSAYDKRQERLARTFLMFGFDDIRRAVLRHLTERYAPDPLRGWVVDLLHDMLQFRPAARPDTVALNVRHFIDCFCQAHLDWVNQHVVARFGMLFRKDVPCVNLAADQQGVDVSTVHGYRVNLAHICALIDAPDLTETAWRIFLRFLVGSGYRIGTEHGQYRVLCASVFVAGIYWDDYTDALTTLPTVYTLSVGDLTRTALQILENEDYQLETSCFGL
jgi:serine/threonine protein kinase